MMKNNKKDKAQTNTRVVITPGSFVVFTRAPWYKQLWNLIRYGKRIKNNVIDAIISNCCVVDDSVILEKELGSKCTIYRLSKPYSEQEYKKWWNLLWNYSEDKKINELVTPKEFAEIANIIRPNTFDSECDSIEKLTKNKYYKQVQCR